MTRFIVSSHGNTPPAAGLKNPTGKCGLRQRIDLSEIYLDDGDLVAVEALLAPVVAGGNPEVNWRPIRGALAIWHA
jgi:hypothetical protein